jgi:hypothetical protein
MLLKQGTEIIIGYELDEEQEVEFKYTLESDWEFPAGDSFVTNVVIPEIEAHLGGDMDNEDGYPRAQCWRADYVTADGEYIDLINFEEETA